MSKTLKRIETSWRSVSLPARDVGPELYAQSAAHRIDHA
jgi:hypothetical protein